MENKRGIKATLLILFAVVISYANALGNGLVYDDLLLVAGNTHLRQGWRGVYLIFTSGYWSGAQPFTSGGLYRPLTILSFWAEYSVAGTSPFLYHLDNILLHFVCSVLAYLVMRSFFKDSTAPLFAALLFAVQPVHTEAVAWVSGRAELLCAFFAFLSAYFFVKRPGRGFYSLLCFVFYLLSLLSKESSIVLPAVLALYLLLYEMPEPGHGRARHLSARLYPFAAAVLVYIPVRLLVLGALGPSGQEMAIRSSTSSYNIFLTMCEAFTHYIRLSLLPFSLSADYSFHPPASFIEMKVLFSLLVLMLTLISAGRLIRLSRNLFFAAAWFFIMLLPVSNIIPTGIIMSERALYIPLLGPCMIAGLIFSCAADRREVAGRVSVVFFAAVLALFTAGSIRRNDVWNNQHDFEVYLTQLYTRRIEQFPNDPVYHTILADNFIKVGDYGPAAEKAALRAVQLSPRDAISHYLLAMIYSHGSRHAAALPEARAAVRLTPGCAIYRYLLAVIYWQLQMYDESLPEVMEAIKLNPYSGDYCSLASGLLHLQGRDDEALVMINDAIMLNPSEGEFYLNKAYILNAKGDLDAAHALLEQAEKLSPGNANAFIEDGITLGSRKMYAAAVEKLSRAAVLSPGDPVVRYLLAGAYAGDGQVDRARTELQKALVIKPDYREARALLQSLEE